MPETQNSLYQLAAGHLMNVSPTINRGLGDVVTVREFPPTAKQCCFRVRLSKSFDGDIDPNDNGYFEPDIGTLRRVANPPQSWKNTWGVVAEA